MPGNNMNTVSLSLKSKKNIVDIFIGKLKSILSQATKRNRQIMCPSQSEPKLARGVSFIRFLHADKKSKKKSEDGVLWRRSILMGEKCDPLAFSGVIHYDANGDKVSDPPINSPLRSSLPAFLMLLNLDSVSVNYSEKVNGK